MQILKISLIPTDLTRIPEMPPGVTLPPMPVPTDLYTLVPCDICEILAWMGPRQAAAIRSAAPVAVERICFACMLADSSLWIGIPRRQLGGGAEVEGRPRTLGGDR